ncbi:hypothetical protein [Nitrosomonas sp.]|uniref:hypothetical protein n=1 Tax=Nitrosomonas sp. TaxID=42353 RepID=UPI0025D5871C|nr:hypothetical protein [Nitrosomonas sp.]MBY0483464.1 hypothetical protein [Nitrosomonas sp.]
MKLENLNQIDKEEKDLLAKANRLDEQSKYLARQRNDMQVLSKFIKGMDDRYTFDAEINAEVRRVTDSISHDVFRAVEMKFAAEARELRIEAKLKNQQIKNFLPDSEVQ